VTYPRKSSISSYPLPQISKSYQSAAPRATTESSFERLLIIADYIDAFVLMGLCHNTPLSINADYFWLKMG
jgi:hypothetical protein